MLLITLRTWRRLSVAAAFLFIAAVFTVPASGQGMATQGAVISQTNPDYIYFEGEWWDTVSGANANNMWRNIFAAGASNDRAVRSPGNEGDNNKLNYRFDFSSAGDYHLYGRRLTIGGGNDSLFPPSDFGVDATGTGTTNRWNGWADNTWTELIPDPPGANERPNATFFATGAGTYRVTAGNISNNDILSMQFKARETDLQVDRWVLHKQSGLTAAQLDALTFSGVVINNPQEPVITTIPVSTRAAVPDHLGVGLGDGLNGKWYKQNTGNMLANARTFVDTVQPDATFTATQIDYLRGAADGAADATAVGTFLAPDEMTFLPGSTNNAATSGNNSFWTFDGFIDIPADADSFPNIPGVQVSFGIPSDDATNLVLGGIEVLNNDGGHGFPGGGAGPTLVTFEQAGVYPISLILTQGGGGFGIELTSSLPGTDVGAGALTTPLQSLLFTEVPGVARPDVNGDSVIDINDFEIIRDNFLREGVALAEGDVNQNGVVDLEDFALWKTAFLAAGGAPPANVPEPTSLLLLAVGLAALAAVRRRDRR